ncbi:MAG TPA: methyltransferase domain-containing protein [Candidatus Deferrimicrobium sp.]|nr:methyltransferase domain-containing protein [Candidatus Deferrimicrobium sp.]
MNALDGQAWDERYRGSELVWGAGPNRFLVEEVTDLTPGTALDVACGEGRNAIWLAEQGWRVVGVDFSQVGLEKARRLAAERGVTVEWQQGDLTTWVTPNTFDLVIAMYLHVPADVRHPVFARMAASVAPGGTMLVVGHDVLNLSEGYGGPQNPEILYGPAEVVGDLDGVLEIERAERVHRPLSTPDGEATAIDVLVRGRRRDEP